MTPGAVTIKLFGALRAYRPDDLGGAPHHPFSFVVPLPCTAGEVARRVGLPEDLVHVVAVNGEAAEASSVVQAGDTIHFFPPVAGGGLVSRAGSTAETLFTGARPAQR